MNKEMLTSLDLPPEATEALDLVTTFFNENHFATKTWLEAPALALGNMRPIDLLKTEEGRHQVIKLIWNLENGVSV